MFLAPDCVRQFFQKKKQIQRNKINRFIIFLAFQFEQIEFLFYYENFEALGLAFFEKKKKKKAKYLQFAKKIEKVNKNLNCLAVMRKFREKERK